MKKSAKNREHTLYPLVGKWAKKHFKAFRVAINRGLKFGRIDITCVRDVGGDLSGDIEVISIEVKRGREPFATSSGQALGYKVYANRVYLADIREEAFSYDEIMIASHLGIGLIQISNNRCKEVLSSPFYHPLTKLQLALLEHLQLGKCQICGTFFQIGGKVNDYTSNRFSRLAREDLKKAIENERGMMFWNRELGERKNRLGIRTSGDGSTYERRFICPDCVGYFLSQIK